MPNEELPNEQQQALIERFLVTFNKIEDHLRHVLQQPSEMTFTRLVDLYGSKQPTWFDQEGYQLRIYADLRNALVHLRREPKQYLSVPLPYVVERIEQICNELIRPEKVIPKFQRLVNKLQVSDPLSVALKAINDHAYSQFPVYDGGRQFRGLLTENGITRWIADQVTNQVTLIEFDDTLIDEVLSREESRANCEFVSRNRAVLDVLGMFSSKPLLEAILITHDGKPDQKLQGIITRSDVQKFLK